MINGEITGFNRSPKTNRGVNGNASRRRSAYIGISRNSSNWQALINVKDKKKYIGTFTDELEAAKTYDLFAMTLQGNRSKLNFDYTRNEVIDAIDHYISEGKVDMRNSH